MNPVSVVPSSMDVDGTLQQGETATYPDGIQWFSWQLTRGRSFSLRSE